MRLRLRMDAEGCVEIRDDLAAAGPGVEDRLTEDGAGGLRAKVPWPVELNFEDALCFEANKRHLRDAG